MACRPPWLRNDLPDPPLQLRLNRPNIEKWSIRKTFVESLGQFPFFGPKLRECGLMKAPVKQNNSE